MFINPACQRGVLLLKGKDPSISVGDDVLFQGRMTYNSWPDDVLPGARHPERSRGVFCLKERALQVGRNRSALPAKRKNRA